MRQAQGIPSEVRHVQDMLPEPLAQGRDTGRDKGQLVEAFDGPGPGRGRWAEGKGRMVKGRSGDAPDAAWFFGWAPGLTRVSRNHQVLSKYSKRSNRRWE